MEDLLTVRRWRRYGADRLYVTQDSGRPVGSVDLQSGEVSAADPAMEAELRKAAQAFLRADVAELVLPATTVRAQEDLRRLDAAIDEWLGKSVSATGASAQRGSSVGQRLDRLAEEGWETVHDVPLGRQGSLVEHLLIGPGGLFTVTERRHPGERVRAHGRVVTVGGQPVSYLRDSRLEAARTQDRLMAAGCAQIHVRGVLVLQGELDLEPTVSPTDPLAVPRSQVPAVFRRMPTVLDEVRVSALAKVARRRTTWMG